MRENDWWPLERYPDAADRYDEPADLRPKPAAACTCPGGGTGYTTNPMLCKSCGGARQFSAPFPPEPPAGSARAETLRSLNNSLAGRVDDLTRAFDEAQNRSTRLEAQRDALADALELLRDFVARHSLNCRMGGDLAVIQREGHVALRKAGRS